MDKYEYQLKTEHIRQVAARKEYGEAAKLCDTIDWTKIRDVKMLTLAADVYTAVGEYEKAIDILQQAYEYAAMGRRIVYRLTELALKADSYDDAKNYFEEFCRIAPNDQGRYILLYKMARYQKATLDEKIKILEAYKREDFDEKWAYELAVLYAMNNEKDKCIQLCDDIILWFGLGKYVEKALSLKSQFAPLTPAQKEKVQKFADKKAQEENEKLQKKQEEQEKKEMELLAKHKVNFIVLARYMQVISEKMIDAYPNRIINIHHSFLPAFVGAKPYHAAFERGVKIIGATSHYVTTELDASNSVVT